MRSKGARLETISLIRLKALLVVTAISILIIPSWKEMIGLIFTMEPRMAR